MQDNRNIYKKYVPEKYVDSLPEFAQIIFEIDLEECEKMKFYHHFLEQYLNSEKIKDKTEGMKILFLKGKYQGSLSSDGIKKISGPGYYKRTICISREPGDDQLI